MTMLDPKTRFRLGVTEGYSGAGITAHIMDSWNCYRVVWVDNHWSGEHRGSGSVSFRDKAIMAGAHAELLRLNGEAA